MMTPRKVQAFLFAGSCLLVTLVLLFSGILNIGSFRKNYVESLVGSYTVAGGEARRQIEYALKYGKVLDHFANIEEILGEIPKSTPAIEAVSIVLPDNRIVYDLQGAVVGRRLPDELKETARFRGEKARTAFTWVLARGNYHAFLPIRNNHGAWAGTIDLQFDPAAVNEKIRGYLRESVAIMLAVGLGAMALLGLLLFRIRVVDPEGRIEKRRYSTIMLVVLSLAQIAYGAVNITMFRRAYPPIVQENTLRTGRIIRATVASIVQKGISYQDMVGMEDWLGRIVQAVPELERIDVENGQGTILYSTAPPAGRLPAEAAHGFRLPMDADPTGARAALHIQLSKTYLASKVRTLALDAASMLVTSFFFMVEMIVFLGLMFRLALTRQTRTDRASLLEDSDELVRPLAFLLLISGYLSVSFIPVMMRDLYEPLLGLAPSVVIGLPISVEMFGAFLSSLLIGHVIDLKGWRPAFLLGLAVFGVGTVLSGTATSAIPFILARGVTGLGYGAAWMGLRGLVAAGATGAARNRGFSVLNAGIFAGQSCGAVLGAMLAERLGFPGVFFLAAALMLVTAGFALVLMRNVRPASTGAARVGFAQTRAFFADRSLIAFLLLVTIPSAVCGMFLNYFLPVYAKSAGVSQGNIGRTFLAYGVCIIYVGPMLIQLMGRLRSQRVMSLASLLGASALGLFCVRPSFATAVAGVVLLGIADSIGLVSQNSYFVNLPAALAFGQGKALSIFSAVKKVGQMLGPYAFGMAAVLGTVPGVALIAGASFAATGVFWISNPKKTGKQALEPGKG